MKETGKGRGGEDGTSGIYFIAAFSATLALALVRSFAPCRPGRPSFDLALGELWHGIDSLQFRPLGGRGRERGREREKERERRDGVKSE